MSRIRAVSASVAAVAVVAGAALVMSGPAAQSSAAAAVIARYSPLGATANGPSGPGTAKFTATPHCCPSTAVVLTPTAVSTESDFQWVVLGVPWDNGTVTDVQVCYAAKGKGYISQTRVVEMTTPDSATVRVDEPTDRTDPGPTCYTVPAKFTPTGSLAVELKVVFASTTDRITLGMVALGGVAV